MNGKYIKRPQKVFAYTKSKIVQYNFRNDQFDS